MGLAIGAVVPVEYRVVTSVMSSTRRAIGLHRRLQPLLRPPRAGLAEELLAKRLTVCGLPGSRRTASSAREVLHTPHQTPSRQAQATKRLSICNQNTY